MQELAAAVHGNLRLCPLGAWSVHLCHGQGLVGERGTERERQEERERGRGREGGEERGREVEREGGKRETI